MLLPTVRSAAERSVSFAIQHHPKRADIAAVLAAAIGGVVDTVSDPEPNGLRSAWRTYRHVLEQTPRGATHRVVVQDDATVCNGFRAAVEAAVAAQPDRLIVLFVGGAPREHKDALYAASRRGMPWAELTNSRWTPVVAVCWPVRMIVPLLKFVDAQRWKPSFNADDEIVGRFMAQAGERPLATVPSLVQHADEVPSLVGLRALAGHDQTRVAACWIGGCDPAGIDWTEGP